MTKFEHQQISYGSDDWKSIRLDKNEIHLWRVSLTPSQKLLDACIAALSEIELKRMDFFEFANVKQNYVVSQGMMRILTGLYLKKDPHEVVLGRHSKGKPFSLDDQSLYFNNSNSGNYCIYGYSRCGELGIDLEQERSLNDLEELIEKNLTDLEVNHLNRTEDRLKTFYRYWTIKESYLKAIGEGMRIEPDKLEFNLSGQQIIFNGMSGLVEPEDWNFAEFPFDDYLRALTFSAKSECTVLDFEII